MDKDRKAILERRDRTKAKKGELGKITSTQVESSTPMTVE